MTVIVYRDGVLAADTGRWMGGIIVGYRSKIRRLDDGRLYAGSGHSCDIDACFSWLNGGEKPRELKDNEEFGAVIIGPQQIDKIDKYFRSYDAIGCPYVVEGAHSEFLLGALAAGATAEEAVRLAIQYGDSAAGDVQVERL